NAKIHANSGRPTVSVVSAFRRTLACTRSVRPETTMKIAGFQNGSVTATCVAFAGALVIAGGLRAGVPEPVKTDAGVLSGTSAAAPGVRVFKGVPFAAPPVGALRWRAPQPVAKWTGVRKADTFGDVCVQPKGIGRLNVSVDLPDSPAASEDCLYLNVWTAAQSPSERRPVMFWIFGGAYTEGAGSSPHNDGEALARQGAVVVTFNYRLGPFGFFSHPELTKQSGHDASGNQALFDTMAALKWMQTNIAAFGGDPRNVTILGESAGAAIAAGLVGSNKDEGTFAGDMTAVAWTNRVKQRWGDLADDYLKVYPAGSDEEATRSSQVAFRDELAWHMRLYASLQARRGQRAYWYFFTHEPPYAPNARNLKATHAV